MTNGSPKGDPFVIRCGSKKVLILSNEDFFGGLKLCFEVVAAIMAIEHSLIAGEPLSALPDVTFSAALLDNRHPPVIADKDHCSDHPLYENPKDIYPPQKYRPETAVLAAFI